jgi:peptide deformylase
MKLSILQYGDPMLRAKGKRVGTIDNRIRELAQNMKETMYAASGVGLAAQQVGEVLQLTVIDVSEVEDRPSTIKLNGERVDLNATMPLVLVNPEISSAGHEEWGIEGCLSIPGVSDEVLRPSTVIAYADDLDGNRLEIEATGLLARALQHEIDHLKGILFTDRLTAARKMKWRRQLRELEKETQMASKRNRSRDPSRNPAATVKRGE